VFYAFYCKKLLVARNRDLGGHNRPLGLEDVKRTGGVQLQTFAASTSTLSIGSIMDFCK